MPALHKHAHWSSHTSPNANFPWTMSSPFPKLQIHRWWMTLSWGLVKICDNQPTPRCLKISFTWNCCRDRSVLESDCGSLWTERFVEPRGLGWSLSASAERGSTAHPWTTFFEHGLTLHSEIWCQVPKWRLALDFRRMEAAALVFLCWTSQEWWVISLGKSWD